MHFGEKCSAPEPPIIPTFQVPCHEEPRFSCFVESEAAGVSTELNLFRILESERISRNWYF